MKTLLHLTILSDDYDDGGKLCIEIKRAMKVVLAYTDMNLTLSF